MTLWVTIGFLLAAYSVIANDSVQTLGTFIASNSKKINWYWMWLAASIVLTATITYSWVFYNGDISYGRLTSIPYQPVEWYHALAPGVLLLLTYYGVPVSTSFLVLSAFASSFILEKMLLKSMMGYATAAIFAYCVWFILSKVINEKIPVNNKHKKFWRILQWITTGLLWWAWLSHDVANIAVFLPRSLSLELVILTILVFIIGLGIMFKNQGGKIQNIVLEKHNTKYVRSATIIDFIYWLTLWFFKELNNIPMSTTWVFVGLLCGRELAIAQFSKKGKVKKVFPLVAKDFIKMMIGLAVSILIIMLIHYVL